MKNCVRIVLIAVYIGVLFLMLFKPNRNNYIKELVLKVIQKEINEITNNNSNSTKIIENIKFKKLPEAIIIGVAKSGKY